MCCKPLLDLSVTIGGVRRWGTLGDVFGPVEHITGTSDRSPATLPELARRMGRRDLSSPGPDATHPPDLGYVGPRVRVPGWGTQRTPTTYPTTVEKWCNFSRGGWMGTSDRLLR